MNTVDSSHILLVVVPGMSSHPFDVLRSLALRSGHVTEEGGRRGLKKPFLSSEVGFNRRSATTVDSVLSAMSDDNGTE